jgi:hypothetical protein
MHKYMHLASQIMEDLQNQLDLYNRSQRLQDLNSQSTYSIPLLPIVMPDSTSIITAELSNFVLLDLDNEEVTLSLDPRRTLTALALIAFSGFDAHSAFASKSQKPQLIVDAPLESHGLERLLQICCIYPPV